VRIVAAIFAAAGLAPTVAGLGDPGMVEAMRDSAAIRTAMDHGHVLDAVATLSPEFLPATYRLPDPRFATGPFYFRSHDLLPPVAETQAQLVSGPRLEASLGVRPAAVLTGGEGAWTAGDAALDGELERWAERHGYRPVDVPGGRFRLWLRPG
jgi:hypothetical protein